VLRADASRNRSQLLEVATRVFVSAGGTKPSVRAIAREAGVGFAPCYRHFPTRESLVDAVYRDQVARLTDGARELLAQLPVGRCPSAVLSCLVDRANPALLAHRVLLSPSAVSLVSDLPFSQVSKRLARLTL
jgi:AcrR family transcriptional regulator